MSNPEKFRQLHSQITDIAAELVVTGIQSTIDKITSKTLQKLNEKYGQQGSIAEHITTQALQAIQPIEPPNT